MTVRVRQGNSAGYFPGVSQFLTKSQAQHLLSERCLAGKLDFTNVFPFQGLIPVVYKQLSLQAESISMSRQSGDVRPLRSRKCENLWKYFYHNVMSMQQEPYR